MHIIEKKLSARTGRIEDCEDMIFVSDWFACVIDGVTFKGKNGYISKTPGQIAANLICHEIQKFPVEICGYEAITSLINSISEYCISNYDSDKVDDFKRYIAASVAIYSNSKREVWIVGDCQVLVGKQHFCYRSLIDTTMANARALFLQGELLQGKSIDDLLENDTGRKFIKPLLEQQGLFLNTDKSSNFCYNAICGIPLPKRFVFEPIKIPNNVNEIVLATDGYPEIEDTLKASEEKLKYILNNDPLCIDIKKSTKGLKIGNESFDDRAYLKIDIST